jgi:YbbR domain-containing protein
MTLGFVTHNLGWKLASLAAAILIWFNIANEPELTAVVSAPVEYKNYPKDLEISSNVIEDVAVEARGLAGQIRSLSSDHVAAIIDFAPVKTAGERTVTLSPAQLNLPRGVELIRIIPAQLRFRFERRATKMVRVETPFSGALARGLVIESDQIVPPRLQIVGPESRVNAVDKATSDPFDLSQVSGDSQQKLSVYISEPEVRFVSPAQVTVKVRVRKTH